MTEDEAKTKHCPMSFNTPNQEDLILCLASGCMMWRWDVDWDDVADISQTQGSCGMGL